MSGSGNGTKHLLTRVEVPEGKQMLVSITGMFTSLQSTSPVFDIGGIGCYGPSSRGVHASASAILTESGDVNVITKLASGNSRFEGKVYTTEI